MAEAITAVVCTRNRGALVRGAARSILANGHPAFRLVVIDQSANDESAAALADLRSDPRLVYVRSNTVGLSRARNISLRMVDTDVVAFTDDDCEVPGDWLASLQAVLSEHPKVAVPFCSVLAGPHDE